MSGARQSISEPSEGHALRNVVAAWAVHAFTASGIVFGFLALVAILKGNEAQAFLWLGIALFVDGIDGALARRARVTEVIPQFDGRTLDNVVDFFNYVAVPVMMIYWFNLVPAGWATASSAAIMAVSLYTFANNGVKSDDYYFVGFPAVWNLVVLYFILLGTNLWFNLGFIALCLALTPTQLKFVHPLRVKDFRPVTIGATLLWGVATLWLVLERGGYIEGASRTAYWIWLASSLWFFALSVWRSFRPAEPGEA
jgi:phosphatidylcholine synthase